MQKITKQIPFQRFHKSEYRNLVKELITVVTAFPEQSVFIKTWIDRLKQAGQQLDNLDVRKGKHPDTAGLLKARNKSLDLIKSILGQVKKLKQAQLESQASDLLLLDAFVSQYLQPIVKTDWSNRTFNLDKMFAALSADTNLSSAIANLNMNVFFDQLSDFINVQKTIRENRSASLRQQQKVNTIAVRSTATVVIRDLFASIELTQIEHPEVDFTEMVNGINQSLNYYISQAKTRRTLNGKKLETQTTLSETNATTNVA